MNFNSFFHFEHKFINYSSEHLTILAFFTILGILFIKYVSKLKKNAQIKILLTTTIFICVFQLFKIAVKISNGTFTVTTDLPLHLCNFLPFVLIYVFWKESKEAWSVMFFWVVLGCAQANFTPAVNESLFYYDAVRYWLVHTFLVILTIYPAIAWKWGLTFRDVWRTLIWLNFTAFLIYFMNLYFKSNYLYLMEKPPGTNFYSILPEWPYYIISLEFILFGFASIVLLIYKLLKKIRR